MMFKTKKFTLIEVFVAASVTGANSRVYIQNQPQLQTIANDRTIFIKAIEAFSVEQITKSPLTSGNSVANAAAMKNATLTVVSKGTEDLQQIPLALLCRNLGSTAVPHVWEPFLLDNLFQVDWSKSYVQMVEAPSGPFSYLFGIHYSEAADIAGADKNSFQSF